VPVPLGFVLAALAHGEPLVVASSPRDHSSGEKIKSSDESKTPRVM
jgi:hypothetical protein